MTVQKALLAADSQTPTLQSHDVVAGLGLAPRDLLATCLALFEDSTLQQRLSDRIEAVSRRIGSNPSQAAADTQATLSSLQLRMTVWRNAAAHDDVLRLVLWMRLREAFDLPPLTFGTLRSARTAADDVVVATLRSIQPEGLVEAAKRWTGVGEQREIPDSLDALARQTLAELVSSVMQADDAASATAREALLRTMKERVAQLDEESRTRLLEAINAREFNDDAIRTMLLTGGGLATFGGAVSVAGFSAYILAAQASAFIPLVSGPALVSFVAVLSNPITIVLATVGAGVWAARSANRKIQSAIAMRVISLLALTGIAAGDAGLRGMAQAFLRLPGVTSAGTLDGKVLAAYQADWKTIEPAQRNAVSLELRTLQVMERPIPDSQSTDRWERLLQKGDGAVQDMAAMSVLTLGELAYHIHSLDPAVLAAADFSRVEDLDDPIAFAAFAHSIEALGADSHLGAISNLKGYVAEQVVAGELVRQGHLVEFPDTSNQAGWDIAVDGVKFQVKNATDLDLLARHFDKGYDYPILANSEVAELLSKAADEGHVPAWADRVHFVEGYSQDSVQQLTDQTLDAGDAMLHPHVPIFAVTLGAIRQWGRYSSGQVSGSQAVQTVLVNGAFSASLAVAGNFAGVAIGMLVFGPAGALVLGSALPIVSRTQVGNVRKAAEAVTKGALYENWQREADESLVTLLGALERQLVSKGVQVKARGASPKPALLANYLTWRIDEDVRFLREAWLRLKRIEEDQKFKVEDAGDRLLVWLSTCTLHPVTYQNELRRWLEVLARRPTLEQNLVERKERTVSSLKDFWSGVKQGYKEQMSKKKD
ncbi:MAG: hypothetical protein IPF94_10915 [Betaproteobacteria bacterium]|nr:hypothetical protein [Betaproteobacteria bacterium]